MGSSFRLGRFAGIDVYLHWTFSLLIVGAFAYYLFTASLGTALAGVGLILAVFFCVVLHEFGHALAARRYGVPTKDITLYPIGGVARLQRIPERPLQELVVAIAGPLVNVAIAAVLAGVLLALGEPLIPPMEAIGLENPGRAFFANLFLINVVLVVFNLLPAFPMDGGRVLRALLALKLEYAKATQIAARIGQIMAFGFAVLGLVSGDFILVFIAAFVFFGAQQEASATLTRSAIRGFTVAQAMLTDFHPLGPTSTLSDAVRLLLDGSEQEFVVTAEGTPSSHAVGVLTRKRLIEALTDRPHETPLQEVMEPVCSPVEAGNPLDVALERMQEDECPLLPVVHAGRLVGLLTLENVGELMMLASAVQRRGARPGDVIATSRPEPVL